MKILALLLALLPVQALAQDIYDPTFSNQVHIPGYLPIVTCRYEIRYELVGYREKWVKVGRCWAKVKEPLYRQVLVQICHY